MKSINHKDHKVLHKGLKDSNLHGFDFVCFVPSLCTLWLNFLKSKTDNRIKIIMRIQI